MLQRAVQGVVVLALLMAVVTGPAGASVNLAIIGSAQISGDATNTPHNLIYDSSQSLLWLDYSYVADWSNAMSWAETLILTNVNTPAYIVNFSSGWRLPTVDNPTAWNLTADSEMGRLYYTNLGLTQNNGVTDVRSANQRPFVDIRRSFYWSSTVFTGSGAGTGNITCAFDTTNGFQGGSDSINTIYPALAVHSASLVAVPEPSTYALLCLSLGVVGFARKKMVRSNG